MKNAALAILMLSVVAAAGVASSQPNCDTCDRALNLTPAEWSCLRQRLPTLSTASGDPQVISLAPDVCAREENGGVPTRGATVRGSAAPVAPGVPPAVLELSKSQLRCLAAHAGAVAATGDRVQVNLNTLCPN